MIILICMLFCHVVDDYYLQGWLASTKQKEWWEKNAPNPLYRYDYLMALFMHGFSWAFMITLPILINSILFGGNYHPLLLLGNALIHSYIDNEKANKKSINLITDQLLHIIQIITTWVISSFII